MSEDYAEYFAYLREHVVEPFYQKRFQSLQAIGLTDILKRKNPYLFKAKNIELAGDLAKSIVDAYLSSQEETVFGNLLEGFAIHVARTQYNGFKSARKSVDLEFVRDGRYYIIGIKSGIYWGNADQIGRMKENFKMAKVQLRDKGIKEEIVAINGCIYGKGVRPHKIDVTDADKSYFKYAGQDFWQFVSEDDDLYRQIIVPVDQESKQKDEAFRIAYAAKVNELTAEFSSRFLVNGQIDWLGLVEYVSGSRSSAIPNENPTE